MPDQLAGLDPHLPRDGHVRRGHMAPVAARHCAGGLHHEDGGPDENHLHQPEGRAREGAAREAAPARPAGAPADAPQGLQEGLPTLQADHDPEASVHHAGGEERDDQEAAVDRRRAQPHRPADQREVRAAVAHRPEMRLRAEGLRAADHGGRRRRLRHAAGRQVLRLRGLHEQRVLPVLVDGGLPPEGARVGEQVREAAGRLPERHAPLRQPQRGPHARPRHRVQGLRGAAGLGCPEGDRG
mmetsp:Transcript_2324/g.6534  ORF Transcript_2324/g.6534 Transcript_2324/m.6534 type:complete len:241 (-) Transcript_2324:698-1420(-)